MLAPGRPRRGSPQSSRRPSSAWTTLSVHRGRAVNLAGKGEPWHCRGPRGRGNKWAAKAVARRSQARAIRGNNVAGQRADSVRARGRGTPRVRTGGLRAARARAAPASSGGAASAAAGGGVPPPHGSRPQDSAWFKILPYPSFPLPSPTRHLAPGRKAPAHRPQPFGRAGKARPVVRAPACLRFKTLPLVARRWVARDEADPTQGRALLARLHPFPARTLGKPFGGQGR